MNPSAQIHRGARSLLCLDGIRTDDEDIDQADGEGDAHSARENAGEHCSRPAVFDEQQVDCKELRVERGGEREREEFGVHGPLAHEHRGVAPIRRGGRVPPIVQHIFLHIPVRGRRAHHPIRMVAASTQGFGPIDCEVIRCTARVRPRIRGHAPRVMHLAACAASVGVGTASVRRPGLAAPTRTGG